VGRYEISGGQWQWDKIFFSNSFFSPVRVIQPLLRTSHHLRVAHYRKDKRAKPVNFPQNNALSGNVGELGRNSRLFLVDYF
jgi:hypothetical protein